MSSDRWQTVTQAPVAERGVRSRLGKESAPMPFFRCFCVDKSITTVFPADIIADDLEIPAKWRAARNGRRSLAAGIVSPPMRRRAARIGGTGTKPSLPRPAGYGLKGEDQVRPRKAG